MKNWIKKRYKVIVVTGIVIGMCCVSFIWREWTRELSRSNDLAVKRQLDMRFKDAAMLLAEGNTVAELSAIHALNQIAIEASQTEDQKDYVKVIKDILISFIQENSVIEYIKDENGKILTDEYYFSNIDTAYNTKSKIVVQTNKTSKIKNYA